MIDGFEKILEIFASASANKYSQKFIRSLFTLEEYRDIFKICSTEDLKNYLIRATEKEEYELCRVLKKIIKEREIK